MLETLAFVLLQSTDRDLDAALTKLWGSEWATFKYVDRTISGTSTNWTLKARRPNLFALEGEAMSIVADGSTIVVLDKVAKTYMKSELSTESLKQVFERTELIPALLFLDRQGEWLKSARPAGTRTRRGTTLIGTRVVPSSRQIATIYFESPSRKLSQALIETDRDGTIETRILDEFVVEFSPQETAVFVFAPPAGAKEVSPTTVHNSKLAEETAQDVAEGLIPYRKLTWDDFPLVEPSPNGMKAHTNAYCRWRYSSDTRKYGGQILAEITSVRIRSGFNPTKSWKVGNIRDASKDRLLRHEQGHLDINEIYARKLRTFKLSDWPRGEGATESAAKADLKTKLDKFIDDVLAERTRLNKQYDEETNHSILEVIQDQWEKKIREMLNQAS